MLRGMSGLAACNLVERALDDLVGTRQRPVDRIDMLADRDVAHVLRDFDRHDFVVVGRLGIAQIGRAEQAQRAAGQRLEQALRRVQFQRHALRPACRRDWDG